MVFNLKNGKSIFLLFSHRLTKSQVEDLRVLGIEKYVYLPYNLQYIWSNMPHSEISIKDVLEPIIKWLDEKSNVGDFVLVQGDFGAVFLMVDFCLNNGLIPIYSVTKREASEEVLEDGSIVKVSRFNHIAFRRYERL